MDSKYQDIDKPREVTYFHSRIKSNLEQVQTWQILPQIILNVDMLYTCSTGIQAATPRSYTYK